MSRWRAGAVSLVRWSWAASSVAFLLGFLAGVPWLLWRLAGWPLPAHIPSGGELSSFLSGPMSQDIFANLLTCLAWLIWAAFTLETLLATARAIPDIRHGVYTSGAAHPRTGRRHGGERESVLAPAMAGSGHRPTARLATALLSTVILAVMAARPVTGTIALSPTPIAAVSTSAQPATLHSLVRSSTDVREHSPANPRHERESSEAGSRYRHVTVREPKHGLHDSLWRIAERELGSHRRWHEIYQLNVGREQPDGQRLEDPDVIYPGWILRIPNASAAADTTKPPTSPPKTSPPTKNTSPATPEPPTVTAPPTSPTTNPARPTPTIPTQAAAPTSASSTPERPSRPTSATSSAAAAPPSPTPSASVPPSTVSSPAAAARRRQHSATSLGIDLTTGGYVALTFAMTMGAVLVMARARRRRRAYLDNEQTFHLSLTLPPQDSPPVLQALQRAHLRALVGDEDEEPVGDHLRLVQDPGSVPVLPLTSITSIEQNVPDEAVRDQAARDGRQEVRDNTRQEDRATKQPSLETTTGALIDERGPIAIGIEDDHEIQLELHGGQGVGLKGPGVDGAARALVTAALSRVKHPRSAPSLNVLIPYQDALRLFGSEVANDPPPLMAVVTDLEHAMARIEVDALARRRALPHPDLDEDPGEDRNEVGDPLSPQDPPRMTKPGPPKSAAPNLLLVAAPDDTAHPRLKAILQLGRQVGVSALILGPWPAGTTYNVEESGVLTNRPRGRLFTLAREETDDIIDVIRDAFGPTGSRPGPGPILRPENSPSPDSFTRDPQAHLQLLTTNNLPVSNSETTAPAASANPIPTTAPTQHLAPTTAHWPVLPPDDQTHVLTAKPATSPDVSTSTASQRDEEDRGRPSLPDREQSQQEEQTTSTTSTAEAEPSPTPDPNPVPGGGVLQQWKDTTTGAWSAPVSVHVLGQLSLSASGEEVRHGLRGKSQELLLFILLNPAGVSSDTVAETLWPDQPQASSALRSSMKRLRAQLRKVTGLSEQMFLTFASGRYRPDRRLITCDAWQFEAALRRATDVPSLATESQLAQSDLSARAVGATPVRPPGRFLGSGGESADVRLAALREAVSLYQGTLLDGVNYVWLEPFREALRHHALHAFVRYAAAISDNDPETALAALERALPIDPVNETLYRRVMRIQARLGRPEAIAGTLSLLKRNLADIDERPERQTLSLAATLTKNDHDQEP